MRISGDEEYSTSCGPNATLPNNLDKKVDKRWILGKNRLKRERMEEQTKIQVVEKFYKEFYPDKWKLLAITSCEI